MRPPEHSEQTPVFHMTHVSNLPAILRRGSLVAKNNLPGSGVTSIASEEVQARRAKRIIPVMPGGTLHDYVPLYFAPRAPMLYCNHRRSIENAQPQEEIIHLIFYAQEIAENHSIVFFDRHAVLGMAEAFNDLDDLEKIDWRVFFETPLVGGFSKYWQDRYDDSHPHWSNRREIRQAEFLVHQSLNLTCLRQIAVHNPEVQSAVQASLSQAG